MRAACPSHGLTLCNRSFHFFCRAIGWPDWGKGRKRPGRTLLVPRSFDARQADTTIFEALVDARQRFGARKPILEDQERKPLTYTDLIRAAFALGRKIAAFTRAGERV